MKRINIIQLAKKTTVMVLSALMLTSSVPSQAVAEAVDEAATAVAQARAEQQGGEQAERRAVVFDGNGATSGQMDVLDVTADADEVLPSCGFTREGAAFTGWSTTASGKDTADTRAYSVNESATMHGFAASYDENQDGRIGDGERVDLTALAKNGTLTLYAQWTEEDQVSSTEDAVELKDDVDMVDAPKLVDHEVAELDSAEPRAALCAKKTALLAAGDTDGAAEVEAQIQAEDAAADAESSDSAGAGSSENDSASEPLTKADGTSIDSMSVSWITRDTAGHDDGDPKNLPFVLSGSNDYEPGSVRLTIPKNIVKTRDGEPLGSMTLSVPEAPSDRASFAYYELEDSYVLVNMVKLAASTPALFEFTQHDVVPHQIVGNPSKQVEGVSPAGFAATLEVTTPQGTTLSRNDAITATFDTEEHFKSGKNNMQAQNSTVYDTWNSSWPAAFKPQNPEDYVYIDWYAWDTTEGNQAFTSSTTFTVTGDNPEGAILLGVTGPGSASQAAAEGELAATAASSKVLYQETLTAHAYVAIPRDKANDKKSHSFPGKFEFSITSIDDEQTSTHTLNRSLSYQLKDLERIRRPRREYYFEKRGRAVYEGALDKLASGKSVSASYSISSRLFPGADLCTDSYDENTDFAPDQIADDATYSATLIDDALSQGGLASAFSSDEYEYQTLDLSSVPTAYAFAQTTEDGQALVTPYASKEVAKGSWVYRRLDSSYIPLITIEAKTQAGVWVKIATADYTSGSVQITCEPNTGVSANRSRIAFNAGSGYTGVRLTTETTQVKQTDADGNQVIFGGMYLYASPTLRLIGSSQTLRSKVEELFAKNGTPSTNVYNHANVAVSSGERSLYFRSGSDYDTLTGGASLKVTSDMNAEYEKDDESECYNATYTMTAHEQTGFKQRASYDAAVEDGLVDAETAGTFYLLLPMGVYPDASTVALRKGDKVDSVRVVRNYNGSGRALVVIAATLKPSPLIPHDYYEDAPHASVTGTYAYDDAAELGDAPICLGAFESGNAQLGSIPGFMGENNNLIDANAAGYSNNQTAAAVKGYEDLLRGLNPASSANTFVYARTGVQAPSVDRAYVSDWDVLVAANGEGQYDQGTKTPINVYDGGAYSYQMRAKNALESGGLKGVVMYDNLEVAEPSGDNKGDATWQGTFTGIDVSALRARGIEPVVYYAVRDVDLTQGSGDLDLSDSSVWTTALPDDLSQVRAVAVDASRKTDGADFVLGDGETISAIINMRAPSVTDLAGQEGDANAYYDTDGEEEAGMSSGPHAYNSGVVISRRPTGDVLYGKSAATKLGLAEFLLTVSKIWDDNDNADAYRPGSLKVALVADGAGTDFSAELNEENGWKATFEHVPTVNAQGDPIHYAVAESAAEGDGDLHQYYASQSESMESKKSPHYTVTDAFALTNYHDPEVTVVHGVKTWNDENDLVHKRPESIKVNLYADGKLQQSQTVRPNEDNVWEYSFSNLPVNRAANTPIVYTVDEDYVPRYETQITAEGNIINSYDPYGELYISQTLTDATQAALDRNPDFTFRLDVVDEDGSPNGERYAYTVVAADGTDTDATGYLGTGETLSLKQGQTVRIENIPSETTYTVTQVDDAGCALTASKGETGQIRSGKSRAAHASFTNAYSSRGSADVTAVKELIDGKLAAGQYTFQMYEGDTLVRTGFNDKDGKVLFGKLRYTQADDGKTFAYTIREKQGTRGGVTYSQGEIAVTVAVADNGDGTMTTTVTYKGGDGTEEEQSEGNTEKKLVNSYAASGQVTLVAWKNVKNGTLSDGQFAFDITPEQEGDPMPEQTEVRNSAEGTVQFGPIAFTNKDVGKSYSYLVSEVADPADTLVSYDTGSFRYTITPKDDGDGTLSFDQKVERVEADGSTCDVTMPVFENVMADGSLRVEKYAKNGDANTEFTFWLQLTGNGDQELPKSISPSMEKLKKSNMPDLSQAATQQADPESATQPGMLDTLSGWGKSLLGLFLPTEAHAETIEGTLGTAADAATYTYDTDTCVVTVHEGKLGGGSSSSNSVFSKATNAIPATKVQKIVFDPGVVITFGMYLFSGMTSLETVEGTPSITTNTLYSAFYNCSKLSMLDGLAGWNISSVNNTYSMFSGCKSLANLEGIAGWNVSQITNASYMFSGCNSLKSLKGLDAWSLGKSARCDASYLFSSCTSLTDVSALSNWSLGGLKSLNGLLAYCSSLTDLAPLSSWNLSSLAGGDFSCLFNGCKALTDLTPLSSWDTSSFKKMSSMFYGTSIESLDGIAGWDISGVKDVSSLFGGCQKLTDISGIAKWKTGLIVNFGSMFYGCTSLVDVASLRSWDTSSATSVSSMFQKCTSLVHTPDLSSWDLSSVTKAESMFYGCSKLTDLTGLSGITFGKIESFQSMFYECTALKDITGLEAWDVSTVKNMSSLFYRCESLTDISALWQWNTGSLENASAIFCGCKALTNVDALANWKTSKINSLISAFNGCSSLVSISGLSEWDISSITSLRYTFSNAKALSSLSPLRNWNTKRLQDLDSTFNGCMALKSLNGLEEWSIANVKSMSETFESCWSLEDVTALENWDTSSLTRLRWTFRECRKVKDFSAIGTWDVRRVEDMSAAFMDCWSLESLSCFELWDTQSLRELSSTFRRCEKIKSLEGLEDWKTGKITTFDSLFCQCFALVDICAITNWDTHNVTTLAWMFADCNALQEADFSNWDMSNIKNVNSLFYQSKDVRKIVLPRSFETLIKTAAKSSGSWSQWIYFTINLHGQGYIGNNWVPIIGGIESSEDVMDDLSEINAYLIAHSGDLPITLVWQRTADATSVNFDANGGAGYMSTHTWAHGTGDASKGTTLPKSTLYKYDNEFMGWNTAPDGSGTSYADAAVIDKDDENFPAGATVTLYAQWKAADHTAQKTDRGYKITLHGNEAAIINDLPATVGYQLYEETSAGWVLVGSRDASGTIQAGQTSTATFVNSYEPARTAATIQATKTLDGAPAAADAFRFELYSVADDGTQALLQTKANGAGGSVTFDPIEYKAAGTYNYLVREVAGSDSSITYDSAEHKVAVAVTDTGGVLSNTVSYDGADVLPVFKNESKRAALTVTKKVVGTQDTSKAFSFDVKLGQAAPQTIELHAGESKTFDNLQVGSSYTVTEKDLPGGYTADQDTYSGTISADGAQVTVTNRYAVSETTVGITAVKKLVGGTLATGQFKFGLYRKGAGASAEPLAVAYNDAQGNVTFSPVTVYADADFDVREIAEDSNADVTYDTASSKTVHVAVTDNGDGTQTAKQTGEPPVFINTMKTGALVVSNELRDGTAASRSTRFTYTLIATDENGAPLTNLPISVDGSATTIASGGTFMLTGGQSARIELPSRARYTVTQTAAEGFTTEASGSAGTANAAAEAANAAFANTYHASGAFTPSIKKEFRGEALAAGAFEFELRDGVGAWIATAKNAADGSVEFPQVQFDQAEFADVTTKALSYTVQEIAGARDDVAYDTDPVSIAVVVTDDGHGHLTPRVTYSKSGVTGDIAGVITNLRTVILPRTGRSGIWIGIVAGLGVLAASCMTLTRRRRRE